MERRREVVAVTTSPYKREREKGERYLEQIRASLPDGAQAELLDCGAMVVILHADGRIEKLRTPNYKRITP